MRISNQTQKLLIAIVPIVIVFLTFQIMIFDMFGFVWLVWAYMMVWIVMIYLFIKVPQRRKRPLFYLWVLIMFAMFFAAFFLRRHPHALILLPITIGALLITFIAACIVAIFYTERRHPS